MSSPRPGGPGGPPAEVGPTGYYPQQPFHAGWSPDAAPSSGATPGRRRRRGPAFWAGLAGLLVGALVLTTGVYLGVRWLRGSAVLGEVEQATTVHGRRLDPGHCVQELPQDGDLAEVVVVPCSEPHEAEVIGLRDLRDESWTEIDELVTTVARSCEMDRAQREAGWRPVVWAPSEASWGQGDRTGTCLAWFEGGKATGSWTRGDDVVPAP